jgi:hypothetical protein
MNLSVRDVWGRPVLRLQLELDINVQLGGDGADRGEKLLAFGAGRIEPPDLQNDSSALRLRKIAEELPGLDKGKTGIDLVLQRHKMIVLLDLPRQLIDDDEQRRRVLVLWDDEVDRVRCHDAHCGPREKRSEFAASTLRGVLVR